MIRAVLFDLGGVMIDWNPRHLYRRLFDDEGAMEAFLATVCNSAWNEEQDAGRPFAEGVRLLTAQYPHFATEIAAYDLNWDEMLKGPIVDSVALLADLRGTGIGLYALTNWSAEKYPVARDSYDFLRWFDGILVSGEEKLRKPDPRIFRLAVDRFGLTPATTLFVDDQPRNTEAAARLGFQVHTFADAATLRALLAEREIMPA